MEMIAYTLFYFLRGSLPWQGLPAKNGDERYKKVKKKKYETSLDMLASGQPAEFKQFFEYVRGLAFEEEPDYKACSALFDQCMKRMKLSPKDNDWCWKAHVPDAQYPLQDDPLQKEFLTEKEKERKKKEALGR